MSAEFIRLACIAAVIVMEWWLMQPYHDPVIARLWQLVMRASYTIARIAGLIGLHAEHEYYVTVEAGI